MGLLKFPRERINMGGSNAPKWFDDIVQGFIKKADSIINGRGIQIFERILYQIISENRVQHYDSNESYHEKLILLQNARIDREDVGNIDLISDGGMTYKIRGYEEIIFTRGELEKIGNTYTQLKIPELP